MKKRTVTHIKGKKYENSNYEEYREKIAFYIFIMNILFFVCAFLRRIILKPFYIKCNFL